MTKITNMKLLRERLLKAIEDFEDGRIEVDQALTLVKLSDSIINGLNCEMKYAALTNQRPVIQFYGEENAMLLRKEDLKKIS